MIVSALDKDPDLSYNTVNGYFIRNRTNVGKAPSAKPYGL